MWEETISPSFHLLHGHRPIVVGQIWPCVCACWASQVHICNIQDQFPTPVCFGVLFIKLAFSEVSPGRTPEGHISFGKSSVSHEEVEAACRRCVASGKNKMFGGALGSDLSERQNIYTSCRSHCSRCWKVFQSNVASDRTFSANYPNVLGLTELSTTRDYDPFPINYS